MNARKVTALFIFAIALLIAGYDITMFLLFGRFSTISDLMRTCGVNWPLLPPLVAFGMGTLYGHIFLTPDTGKPTKGK